jgi:hypothetical protein
LPGHLHRTRQPAGLHPPLAIDSQAANISLNGKFTFAHFLLPPEDPRSITIHAGVNGSHLTATYATIKAAVGVVHVEFGPARPHKARVQVVAAPRSHASPSHDRSPAFDYWLGTDDGPVTLAGGVKIEVRAAAPVAVVVANTHWEYTLTPGTYRTAADGAPHTRVDVSIAALTDPLTARVAPHGLIGQGFDGLHIDGKVDSYQPDKDGLFTTSAQGERAIEGNVDGYLVQPQEDPFSTNFKFARFGAQSAPPRDTSKLNAPAAGGVATLLGTASGRTLSESTDCCLAESSALPCVETDSICNQSLFLDVNHIVPQLTTSLQSNCYEVQEAYHSARCCSGEGSGGDVNLTTIPSALEAWWALPHNNTYTLTYQTCDLDEAGSASMIDIVVGDSFVSLAGVGRAETKTVTFQSTVPPTEISIAWPDEDGACFEAFSVEGIAAAGTPMWLDNPVSGVYAWFEGANATQAAVATRLRRLYLVNDHVDNAAAGNNNTCDCTVSCTCATESATFDLPTAPAPPVAPPPNIPVGNDRRLVTDVPSPPPPSLPAPNIPVGNGRRLDVCPQCADPYHADCPACAALFSSTVAQPASSPLRTAEIVMAQCLKQRLDAIPSLAAAVADKNIELLRVSIYSKCGRVPEKPDVRVPVSISEEENTGRNDQTWALHFARRSAARHHARTHARAHARTAPPPISALRYGQLADLVIVVKDTHFDYPVPAFAALAVPFDTLLDEIDTRSFACARRADSENSVWHARDALWQFRLSEYRSALESTATTDFSPAAMDMAAFLQASLAPEEFARLADDALHPVCYGGSFVVRRSSVAKIRRETWSRLADALSRYDNLEEGHFLERAWAALLSPPLSSHPLGDSFSVFTRNAQTTIPNTTYLGALQYCLCADRAAQVDAWQVDE